MENLIIEELITYAKFHLGMSEIDSIYVRNILMRKLHVSVPFDGKLDKDYIKNLTVPDELMEKLRCYVLEKKLIPPESVDLFITEILGDLTPLPSMVINKFNSFSNSKDALEYLYDLQIKNNYIQKTAVDKNLHWIAKFTDNYLELSINLSKPEKKNSDVAKLINNPVIKKYPNCMLCKENLGFYGHKSHPARENLRIIPVKLDNTTWYIQFSPYVYYNQHCIVFDEIHQNMTMGIEKFRKLLDFVDLFPSYFIGSNSELPIVGGSILNHEHFQGGEHLMPIMFAKDLFVIPTKKYPNCKLSYLNFFNSTFKIESTNRQEVLALMEDFYAKWRVYDDPEIDVLSHSDTLQHSTITPIVRKINNTYIVFMVLRNNLTSPEHPDGIFHSHKEYHNIKSEGIGLIESSGLFILPARLKRQIDGIKDILSNKFIDLEKFIQDNPDYELHRNFINELITKYGRNLTPNDAQEVIIQGINAICMKILENTAIFKNTEKGQIHLKQFIQYLDLN